MTEHMFKLTVAILTYNRRDYLYETLESLTQQSFKDFEVIIFDNASDYDLYEFVELFPNLHIKIDANKINLGNIANFRKMIAHNFTSPYVIMFHDDDTIHPEYFTKAIAFLDTHKDVVWVGSNITFIKDATPMKMKYFKPGIAESSFVEIKRQALIHKLLGGFSLGFNSVIYRSEVLRTARERYDEFNKWLDRPFMIDLLEDAKAAIAEGQFINYRIHPGQDSQFVEPLRLQNVVDLFKYYRTTNGGHDMKRYNTLETDNAINTANHTATTFAEFFHIISVFKKEGMFRAHSIGWKGVYYFCRFILKYIRLRFRT